MYHPEEEPRPFLQDFLKERAKSAGLSFKYLEEIPWAWEMLNRLDKIKSNVKVGQRESMLYESLLSASWVEKNPTLIQETLGCDGGEELSKMQRDMIRGSLLSDLGKVSDSDLTWLYNGLNFDQKELGGKLNDFQMERYGEVRYLSYMQLPYSAAMDFYRELNLNGSEVGMTGWDHQRESCDGKIRKLGFKVNVGKNHEFEDGENTFLDVATGAHLAVLPELLEKWGIDKDPEWTRSIFIAQNHHLCRGVVSGMLLPSEESLFAKILPEDAEDKNILLRMALLEEFLDGLIASIVRQPRQGDSWGTNAKLRMLDNLKLSQREGRVTTEDRGLIVTILRSMGPGWKLKENMQTFLDTKR